MASDFIGGKIYLCHLLNTSLESSFSINKPDVQDIFLKLRKGKKDKKYITKLLGGTPRATNEDKGWMVDD